MELSTNKGPVREKSGRSIDFGFLGPLVMVAVIMGARYLFPDKLAFFTEASIYAIYVMGNNILMGYLGYVSFGQPFYLSTGAYAAAIYFAYLGNSPIVAILLAVAVGLALSAVFGPIFMRLKGNYYTLVNAALCAIGLFTYEKLLIGVTNGNDGLWFRARIAKMPFLDVRLTSNLFLMVCVILALLLFLYRWMDKSALGAVFRATKINSRKAKFLGYNPYAVRIIGFTLATVLSTIAGALFAINYGFVNPNLGENSRSIEVLIATLLGGVGSVYGPVFGAFGFLGIKDIVSRFMSRWEFAVGIITILVLFFFSKGIWGFIRLIGKGVTEKLFRKKTAGSIGKEK
ncbi:MAG: branched-chain amino acid ABC transporter permease [Rectinemataceae bacterium]